MLEYILLTVLILCALASVIVPAFVAVLRILPWYSTWPSAIEDHTQRASG